MRSINQFIHKTTTIIVLLSLTLSAIQVPTTAVSAQGQDDGIVREFNSDTGKVTLLTGANDQPVAMLSAMSMYMTDQQRADVLVQSFAPEFGVTNPRADLEMMAQSQPAGNRVTTKYQQTYKGVPVMAGELIVNASEQGALYSMNGEVAQALSLDTTPTLTADEAVASAKQGMVKWYGGKEADYKQTQAELWIFDESLLRPSIRPAELVWRVEMIPVDEGQPIRELVLVNAETGNVPLHFNQIDTSWNAVDVPQQETESTVTPTPTEIPTEEPVVMETPVPAATPIPDEIQPTPTPEILPTEVPGEVNALAIATYYVNGATGSDSNSCTTVALPCQHIQQAIEKGSTPGDTIKVASGTYTWSNSALHPNYKNVVIIDRSLALSGGWNVDFSAQNGVSIIDGANTNNGILANSGTTIVENFIIQNSTSNYGGAIYVANGNFTLQNSILKNNSASNGVGGGIYGNGGVIKITNSTISGNTALIGGGVYINNTSSVMIQNSTIAYNNASSSIGGIGRSSPINTVTVTNSIIAFNTASTSPNCYQIHISSYNIIGDTKDCTVTAGVGDQFNVNPQISNILIGSRQVHALLAGSPAIDAGTSTGCPTSDQRGVPRPQGSKCDIGAYEYYVAGPPNSVEIQSGSSQAALTSSVFANPLVAIVKDELGIPISGITVIFSAPANGASGTFTDTSNNVTTAITNIDGVATASAFTANGTIGSYIVEATVLGVAIPAEFQLENSVQTATSITVNAGSQQSTVINKAYGNPLKVLVKDQFANPMQGVTVTFTAPASGASSTFAASGTNETTAITGSDGIATTSILTANGTTGSFTVNATVDGTAAPASFQLVIVSGLYVSPTGVNGATCDNSAAPCQTINYAVSKAATGQIILVAQGMYGAVSISGKSLALLGGWDSTFTNQNGVSTIDGSNTSQVINIYNATANPISIDHFIIQNGNTSIGGGGISIYTNGDILISNTTVKGNTSTDGGGGIYVSNGNVTLRNSTVSNNKAVSGSGGGILLAQSTSVKLAIENSTIVYNVARWGGGLSGTPSNTVNIKNSIIANNEALYDMTDTDGPDCSSTTITTSNYNIIGKKSTCTFPTGTGNQYNVNPFVSEYPLGAFAVHSLTSDSPAINAGDPATCTAKDQRGVSRLADGLCDIGAYEHATPGAAATYGIASGNNQIVGPRLSPTIPLSVYVIDSIGTPVEGAPITFTAPASGPSGVFTSTGTNAITVNTNGNGLAIAQSFVTNLQQGTYNILITASGLPGSLNITLTNKALFVSTSGNDSGNCLTSAQPCRTMDYAISKASSWDTILVAIGTYTGAPNATRVVWNGNINLVGGWNSAFTAQTGMSIIDGENTRTGIYGSPAIDHFIVQNSNPGIDGANIRITNSIIRNNSGGGIRNRGDLTLENSMVVNNTGVEGGAINSYCDGGCVVTIINSTIAYNKATRGGGIWSTNYGSYFANVILHNSIISNNVSSQPYSPNCLKIQVSDHSIISNTAECTIDSNIGSLLDISPKISDYPIGIQNYFVLAPDSPAIDAGNPATCLSTDIRGLSRPEGSACDIGAYEYKTAGAPASLQISNSAYQRFAANTESPNPIVVSITDSLGSPVNGVNVTFSAPASGSSGTFASTGSNTATVSTNGFGIAKAPAFRTNYLPGTFNIIVSSPGLSSKNLTITSVGWYVSPTGNDSAACNMPSVPCLTIETALGKIQSGDTVFVESGTYTKSSGEEVVGIAKDCVLSGGWNSSFTVQNSFSTIDGQNARRGITHIGTASIYNFIIENGSANSWSNEDGGGIYTQNGRLSLFNSIVRNNHATDEGGGIFAGTITLNKTLVENNTANRGGGVNGEVISYSSNFINNSATFGGGLYTYYEPRIINSMIMGNTATQDGGGIYFYDHSGTVNNSTIINNSAGNRGDGIYTGFSSTSLDITNSIITNNAWEDSYGNIRTSSHNLIGRGIDPRFSIYTFGFPGYIPLMEDSPAINHGDPATCASIDQRGLSRPQQGVCDIGAYEYAIPGPAYSTNILGGYWHGSTPGYILARPISIYALDVNGSPVTNSDITLTAPLSGPSGVFTNNSNTTTISPNIYGVADVPAFLANDQLGQYTITTSPGAFPVILNITNGILYVATNGSDAGENSCTDPNQPCQTINAALRQAIPGEGIRISAGTYEETITISKDIIITGGWDNTFTSRSGQTLLDGNNTHRVIFIDSDTYAAIEDINIANGYTSQGAGIYNNGVLSLKNVSVYNNISTADGAGIYQKSGELKLTNVTISNNTAISSGGGIYVYDGIVEINNSTIHQNVATDPVFVAIGGGLSNPFNKPVTISNTIIAGNVSDTEPDCRGQITSGGNNLIGFIGKCVLSTANGDQIGISPLNAKLGNLLDNGGTTLTHALQTDSPAIDAGNALSCAATDQRGTLRPQGSTCDIGAFEGSTSQVVTSIIRTYTSENTNAIPGSLVCDQTCAAEVSSSNPHANYAQQFAKGTYDLYFNQYGRRSIDNNNMPVLSSVHYKSGYDNAFWNGSQMVYGDASNWPMADDVVAHELTHGVTQYESDLFYFYQSGAINESFSDLWGEYYDQTNGVGSDDPSDKWLNGEDVVSIGIRSMSNPPLFKDPDKMSSAYYVKTVEDNGGVHSNSGINNKAVFLMVDGGTFNGQTVTGIGWDKTAAIYYEVNTNLLSSGADYSDLYYAVQQACTNLSLTSYKGITSADCIQVKKAVDAVQMNGQPVAGFNVDAAICPATTITAPALTLFNDNFENGINNWEYFYNSISWEINNSYASSPTHSMWGTDASVSSERYLRTQNGITLPSGTSYLYFKHAFGFEYFGTQYYDGGVLEYSIDNGYTWLDAKPLFSDGKNYAGTISSYSGTTNELKGRSAFVGDSHGYVSSRYNLTSLAGKTVKFQWRLATDRISNYLGWFIDDVKVYTCVGYPSIPAYSAPADKVLSTDYTPLLDWTDATPNIHHYQVQVATDSAFTTPLYDVNNLVTSQYPIPTDLPSNSTYYWRVRAFNILDETKGWTAARTFRTALTPPVLTPLTLPITNNRPTFDWSDVLDTTNYTLQVSTSSTFASFAVNATVNGSNYTPTIDLPAGKTLYWRMRSNGANGPSDWATSSTNFNSANPPSVPVLTAPVDKTLFTNYQPKLDWNNSTVPLGVTLDGYQLQVATDTAFSSTVLDQNVTDKTGIIPTVVSEFTLSTPLAENATYYWRVRSYNSSGQYSAWSLVRSLRTALPAPTLNLSTLPENGKALDSNKPTFNWDDVPGATGYTLQVSTVNTFASFVLNQSTSASTHTPIKDFPANKTLFWRVIATGANGPSLPSNAFTFTTANPPPMPVLSAPVDNTLISNAPKLDWANVVAPAGITLDGYQVQLATDLAFSLNVQTHDVTDKAGTPLAVISEFTPSALAQNTKYYWHVRSFDDKDGNLATQEDRHYSGWSLVRSFRMILPTPVLDAFALPADNATATLKRPLFDWSDVTDATGYTIQVSTVNTFASTLVKTNTVASTFTPTVDLPANKTLFWRVIANGANGPSLPSGSFTFSTANPPPMPVLSAPVDNVLLSNAHKLDWANVVAPVGITLGGYQVQLATDPAFSLDVQTHDVIDKAGTPLAVLSEFTPSALVQNTKYYWHVRSFDSTNHYSSWSLTRSFRMVMPAPTTLTLPADGAPLQTIRPTFDWDDAPGATGYTIQISTVNTFASFVLNIPVTSSTYTPVKDLLANKLLFWRVIANGPNGPSAPSAPHSFTTGTTPPTTPVLSAPVDNLLIADTLTPKLDWANSTVHAGVTFGKYQLEVATDAVFSSIVLTQDVTGGVAVSESTLTAPLSPNTKYYWHVRSVNSLGHFSGWSLARSFRVAMLAPTLVSPTGILTTADLTPVFDWDDVPGASYYSIQISTTNTFTTTLVNTTAPASTFTPTVDLPANTALYWRVLAQGANGPGKWSTHTTFIMQ